LDWSGPQALRLVCARATFSMLVMWLVCRWTAAPAAKWLDILHDKIRQDRYLVGFQLHNNVNDGEHAKTD